MTTWDAVLAAVTTALTADRTRGREELLACWADTGDGDDAQRCVLAHYLADLEPGLDDEIAWDEAALTHHENVRDGDLAPVGIPSASAMLPSLHLNLGDGLLRRGDVEPAGRHLEAGLAAADALGDDGYAAMVRGGLERLRARLHDAAGSVADAHGGPPPTVT